MAWPIWQGLSEGDHCGWVRGRRGDGGLTNLASCSVTSYYGEEAIKGEEREQGGEEKVGRDGQNTNYFPPPKDTEKSLSLFTSGITRGMIIKREAERRMKKGGGEKGKTEKKRS